MAKNSIELTILRFDTNIYIDYLLVKSIIFNIKREVYLLWSRLKGAGLIISHKNIIKSSISGKANKQLYLAQRLKEIFRFYVSSNQVFFLIIIK